MTALPPAYAHVLSLGVLWTSVHCAGMCGPLLCGMQVGGAAPDASRSVGHGLLGVLRYQAGRSLTYCWLGGLAGLLGAGLGRLFTTAGGLFALCFGLAMIGSTLRSPSSLIQLGRRPAQGRLAGASGSAQRLLAPLIRSPHPLREVALGAVMGFLPCMIPAWALGQAALTGSPLHGAAVMLLLVLLTTPVLLLTTQLPRLGGVLAPALRSRLATLLPRLSGLWLGLVGGAGLGLWPHAHLGFTVGSHPFLMMLF